MTTRTYAVMDCDVSPVSYLTAGKEYEVSPMLPDAVNDVMFGIVSDNPEWRLGCRWTRCTHLHGGNWRRIEREYGE